MPANAVSNREGRRCAKAKYYVRNIESLIPPSLSLSLSRSLVPARQLVPNLFPEKFPFRLIILYGHRRCREMMHPTNLLISFSLSLSCQFRNNRSGGTMSRRFWAIFPNKAVSTGNSSKYCLVHPLCCTCS